jgi:hypothetical protein
MGRDDKTSFYDSIVNRAKNNKPVAIGLFVVVVVAGTVSVVSQLLTGSQSIFDWLFGRPITLAAINVVSSEAAPFRDAPGIPCLLQDKVLRTFDPASEHKPGSPLQLAFTFTNNSPKDAIFTAADFVVSQIQETAGGGPGTVEPNHTYKMNLAFRKGSQPLALNPPYKIPPHNTGAFAIDITPAAEGIGLCWILRIEFQTSLGVVKTEEFAITMSKSRSGR